MKKEYPVWLKVAWRFGRVFLAVFVMYLLSNVGDMNTQEAMRGILLGALSAGLVAVGKAIREYVKVANKPLYESLVRKSII